MSNKPDTANAPSETGSEAIIKCVVWDLDDTIWKGTLLEGDDPVLAPGVRDIILELENRGILQSIASKNDHTVAWERLTALGLSDYFVYPQIGWTEKSASLRTIAEQIGIGVDALAFVDDQAFERDEVRFHLPAVMIIDTADLGDLLHVKALQPRFVTNESRLRRQMYQADIQRNEAEQVFLGSRHDFLATLGMVMTIRIASEKDLRRAEELTVRTNQLNTTGRTYSYEELRALRHSCNHLLLVAELEDSYGASGTIGLALVETAANAWILRLLLTSCRVLSRGVGGIMLSQILRSAKRREVKMRAEFIATERNRMMYVTYKFYGFFEVGEQDGTILLEHSLEDIRPFPTYVTVRWHEELDEKK
jgi:FkbH-like protein